MPEKHLPGNPFATAVLDPPAKPKHKPGNPFADPGELDLYPELYPDPKKTAAVESRFDPLSLSRKVRSVARQSVGLAEGLTSMAGRIGAGLVKGTSPVIAAGMLDPTDPQREAALPKSMTDQAAEDAAGNIRKVEKWVLSRLSTVNAPTTTGQKVARAGFNIGGQLAPFVAAGPLGLAAGSGLNVAAEVGAEPEESLLGMFSKEQAKSPIKRGAAALLGDVAIAAPLSVGAKALKNYVRAKTAVSPEELARMGEAIPGAAPPPELPALPPSAPPAAISRVGAIGNQPKGPLPLKEGVRGPVVDLKSYPLAESPAGSRRAEAGVRYNRVTKGGRGEIVDTSWMDESPIKDESTLTDRILSGGQRRLLDLAQTVADASPSGGIVVDPGPKSASSTAAKVGRMAAGARPDLSPLQQLGDLNRASIVVEHPADAGPVLAQLQESGWIKEVDDKFSKPDNLGYGAMHVQLVDPVTKMVAELQIHTPQTFAATNDLGGHFIYDYLFSKNAKPIVTPADHAEARRLIEYIRGVQGEAHSAALTGKPLAGASDNYRLTMETSPDSPEYGRWYVEEKATGNRVAEADNPFKARTIMTELDRAPETPPPVRSAEAQAARLPAPEDVPHGNYPQPDVEKPAVNPFREVHEPVESTLQGPSGSEDVTYFGNRAVRTRWRVVEAPAVITSNHPHTFERNPAYPAAIQGRVYHGTAGQGAREQVVSGAQGLEAPRIVNPTRSIGGPPTVTPEGIVIAGNQRGMMQQRVYDLHPEKAAELRAQIAKDAARVGIDPAALEGMERPVLVREIVDPTVNVRDENALRELNELSDKVTKKAKDPLTEAMGRARQLKSSTGALEHYAATSSAEEPLSEYLQGPNGLKFLNALVADKVLLPAELDGFRDAATGTITKQGRQKIADMMAAAAVGDASIIDAAPAAIVSKLETGTPRLIAAAQTPGWSLEEPLQEALELHTSKVANGQKSIADALAQPDMLGREIAGAKGQMLARFLESNTKTKVSDAMRQWSEAAEKAKLSDGSADMFGVSAETADEAFDRIFGGRKMVGGARKGSIAGPASNDPYNYAAMKMLTSMAGTGIGAGAGATAGSKIGATPEERRRNALLGAGVGGMAGALTPFSPEIAERVLELASKLRSAGAEAPARLFQLHASPEIVRVKISGQPSKEQMKQLFAAVQKNPKASFRYSVRDLQGREVGTGRSLIDFGSDVVFAEKNAPVAGRNLAAELPRFGPPKFKAGAVGNQPEHIVGAAVETPDGKRFTGDWHSDAIDQADEALGRTAGHGMVGADFQRDALDNEGWKLGFQTSKGRFVSREEAFQIARTAGQEPKYVSTSEQGHQLWSGTYRKKGPLEPPAPGKGRIGAVGNQPAEPRVGPRPPQRRVRSAYKEPDYVYWPRNSRASIEKAKTTLNLSTAGLDKTATARVRALIAAGLGKGTIDKGYRSFAEMDLSTLQRKRELLKELVEDPNTLVGADKLKQIPTDDIKAMWMIAHDNTKTIEAAARVMNDPLASASEIASAADLHDKAYKQTEELLSQIVTGTAQKGRELGALRNIAKQSTDPEVWLVQAKRMMGDRPLPDAVQTEIRKLARRAQEACLG